MQTRLVKNSISVSQIHLASLEERVFFTEMLDKVVQIHGKYNRWLGNDPEAIPFVYEYLTKINAKFDKKQLLNTGTGYNPGRTNLNERYLTATTA